jgi:pyruvate dehydrogenase E2 component (dihydrolipoamide acetyltransferase)
VRRLAHDLGVELADVRGSGPGGVVTREDVERFAAEQSSDPAAGLSAAALPTGSAGDPVAPDDRMAPGGDSRPREKRIPIAGVRKHTAAAMVASAFTAPHVTEFLTVDVTATMELLESLRARPQFRQSRLNILTIVVKAICLAVRGTPEVNARWDEAAGEIVQFGYVNLGIAAATPRGLIVPTIEDADRRSLSELADALTELTETARAGRMPPSRLTGGTITLTNVGVFGVDAGTPILNPGEAAILAMGAVRSRPWEYRGEIALRQVMTLSLSFDHRIVDGEQGSRFLAEIGAILANPGYVLALT